MGCNCSQCRRYYVKYDSNTIVTCKYMSCSRAYVYCKTDFAKIISHQGSLTETPEFANIKWRQLLVFRVLRMGGV